MADNTGCFLRFPVASFFPSAKRQPPLLRLCKCHFDHPMLATAQSPAIRSQVIPLPFGAPADINHSRRRMNSQRLMRSM